MIHKIENKQLYYRLIALWVVCEAFAGGIMHAAKIPFTGMIVSSLAVICITLIAYHIPTANSILKATTIVAIFKLLLSPHSPPTAYIAVFFQGYMGHLLFFNRRYFSLAVISLAVLALVESAIQRILVLIVVYGNNFWYAVDQYLQKLIGGASRDYSLLLASCYILLHAITGVCVGIFALKLVKGSTRWKERYASFIITKNPENDPGLPDIERRRKIKPLLIFLWCLLVLLFLHAVLDPNNSLLPAGMVGLILLRSLLIVLSWYLIFSPLLIKLIKYLLDKRQERNSVVANEIMLLLPQVKYIFKQSWILSGNMNGLKRLPFFLRILILNILYDADTNFK